MKHYFYTSPSYYGMGSDYDIFYFTENHLKAFIKNIIRNHEPDRTAINGVAFDTMKAHDADYCLDFEKRFIAAASNRCSTYADWPDLIEIPEFIKPLSRKTVFDKKIFMAFNEWHCYFDVIANHAEFIQYYFNFRYYDPVKIFGNTFALQRRKHKWWEFVEFSMNKVLINTFLDTREKAKDWCERMLAQKNHDEPYGKILSKISKEYPKDFDYRSFIQKDRDDTLLMTPSMITIQNNYYSTLQNHLFVAPFQLPRDAAWITNFCDECYYTPDELFDLGSDVFCLPRQTAVEEKKWKLDGVPCMRALAYIFQV